MAVKVIKGRVKHKNEIYNTGRVIPDMSENEEKRLVDLGVASYYSEEKKLPEEETEKVETGKVEETEDHADEIEVPDVTQMTVNQIKEAVAEITDLEVVQGMLDLEKENSNRTTAISALEDYLTELTKEGE